MAEASDNNTMKGGDIQPGDLFIYERGTYIVREVNTSRHTITLAAGRTDSGFNLYLDPDKDYEVYRYETEYH